MRNGSLAILVVLVAGLVITVGVAMAPSFPPPLSEGPLAVVAAENFWGSIAAQLGGERVHVLSLVSDPNADPHEFESNTTDAVAIADARLVIENGAGYDTWFSHLVAAGGNPSQRVVDVGSVVGVSAGGNPHFWYSLIYVNATAAAVYSALVGLDPGGQTYYAHQFAALNVSLSVLGGKLSRLHSEFPGAPVAATESIFVYLAASAGLDLVSPPEFMDAVSEGVEPPAQSVATFENQLTGGAVDVMAYNSQTQTPLTQQMQSLASSHGVPIVAITETIQPPDATYQAWMGAQLDSLSAALESHPGARGIA